MHIIVIDDHPIVLDGTKALLESVNGWKVTPLSEIETAVETVQQLAPDVVLLDINLGTVNGIMIAEQIKASLAVPIVLYTGYEIEDYYELLLQGKIDGLLSKTATKEVVLAAIQATLRGDVYVPRSFLNYMARQHDEHEELVFSPREVMILEMVARGATNKAIAVELALSQRTIEHALTKIFGLLGVDSRAEAVVKAKDLRVIS